MAVQVQDQLLPLELDVRGERDREPEPARVCVRVDRRQPQLLVVGQPVGQIGVVATAHGDEVVQLLQLSHATRGLHLRDLQVVAHMREHVLVVIAVRQSLELLAVPLLAGVVLARLAPAVPAPVAEGFHQPGELGVVDDHRPAFAHRDVMRREEGQSSQVSEGADVLVAPACAQRVTAVLDQPQVVLLGQGCDLFQIERVAHGVGYEDRLGLVRDR